MTHPTNKKAADQLRQIADFLEKSEQPFGMATHCTGGEAIFAIQPGPGEHRIPRGFAPVQLALLITDPELIKTHEVAVQRKDAPGP